MSKPPAEADLPPRGSAVARLVGRVKAHPVVIAVTAFFTVAFFVSNASGLVGDVVSWVRDKAEPDRETAAAVTELELDISPRRAEQLLGTPTRVGPLCDDPSCPAGTDELRLLVFEKPSVTVRTVFDGSALVLYAVTLVDPDAEPDIDWLGQKSGTLGEQTFAEVVQEAGDGIAPTDLALWQGNRDSIYAEVAALGAPGQYRGLFLGWVSSGAPTAWNGDAALELRGEVTVDPASDSAMAFRESSVPNTYGIYRDDGAAGQLFGAASEVANVLASGA